jgi:hypothetical protein
MKRLHACSDYTCFYAVDGDSTCSETSVTFYHITRRHIPGDNTLYSHCHDKLDPYTDYMIILHEERE